jgi:hypothetical protein
MIGYIPFTIMGIFTLWTTKSFCCTDALYRLFQYNRISFPPFALSHCLDWIIGKPFIKPILISSIKLTVNYVLDIVTHLCLMLLLEMFVNPLYWKSIPTTFTDCQIIHSVIEQQAHHWIVFRTKNLFNQRFQYNWKYPLRHGSSNIVSNEQQDDWCGYTSGRIWDKQTFHCFFQPL